MNRGRRISTTHTKLPMNTCKLETEAIRLLICSVGGLFSCLSHPQIFICGCSGLPVQCAMGQGDQGWGLISYVGRTLVSRARSSHPWSRVWSVCNIAVVSTPRSWQGQSDSLNARRCQQLGTSSQKIKFLQLCHSATTKQFSYGT